MIDKLPISYPALPLGPIEQGGHRAVVPTTSRRSAAVDRNWHWAKVTASALIAAILVLGFVLSIQAVGLEDHPGVGPDRPPHPALPAPAPAPDYAPVAPLLG
jgi:hypothetical protein